MSGDTELGIVNFPLVLFEGEELNEVGVVEFLRGFLRKQVSGIYHVDPANGQDQLIVVVRSVRSYRHAEFRPLLHHFVMAQKHPSLIVHFALYVKGKGVVIHMLKLLGIHILWIFIL